MTARIQSLTEDQLEMLDVCIGIWSNTWARCSRPDVDEVIETFAQCEERSGEVVWTHKSLRIAIAWLKARGFVA